MKVWSSDTDTNKYINKNYSSLIIINPKAAIFKANLILKTLWQPTIQNIDCLSIPVLHHYVFTFPE